MSTSTDRSDFDVVIIGAGPGGYVAAIHAAQLGLRVAVVEKDDRLGGTCLLRGCIPTKALLESASLFERIHRASAFGIKVSGAELDFPGVQKFKASVVDANAKGVAFLLKKYGATVIQGHARLAGLGTVNVTAADGAVTALQARNVVLATGSRCTSLPSIQVDHLNVVDSDDLLDIDAPPKRLLVLGAGAVGVEFASVYHRFGAEVHLLELQDHILPLEDEEISVNLERAFKKQGIKLLTGTRLTDVDPSAPEGGVRVKAQKADGSVIELAGDKLLVAVGRAAVTDDVGLDTVGVEVDDRGYVNVDDHCRTNVPGIFAIGDIIRTPWLAHVASHEGVLAIDQIAGRQPHPLNYDQVPSCTYCHPEVASVGLTEKTARERGYDVNVATFPFKASGKAKIAQETDGLVKIVAENRYDELLGVHIVGHHATELIAEAVAALRLESTVEELMHTIHPHPTLSEAVGEAAHAGVFGQALHF